MTTEATASNDYCQQSTSRRTSPRETSAGAGLHRARGNYPVPKPDFILPPYIDNALTSTHGFLAAYQRCPHTVSDLSHAGLIPVLPMSPPDDPFGTMPLPPFVAPAQRSSPAIQSETGGLEQFPPNNHTFDPYWTIASAAASTHHIGLSDVVGAVVVPDGRPQFAGVRRTRETTPRRMSSVVVSAISRPIAASAHSGHSRVSHEGHHVADTSSATW